MNSKMVYSQKTFFSIVLCISIAAMTSDEKNQSSHPCIRRELLKFKLTNQNSASGKNCAILVLFDVTPIVYIRIG